VNVKVDLGPFQVETSTPNIIHKSQLEPANGTVAAEPANVVTRKHAANAEAAETHGIMYVVCGIVACVIVLPLCYLVLGRKRRSIRQ
jgi:hypothetical protein